MITLDHLISHRFRGFSDIENSLEGLRHALDFGVKHLEFDIRVARCGTPMIFHDEHAKDGQGKSHLLADIMAKDFMAMDGRFAHMPSFDALLSIVANHPHTTAHLLVDIKDAGFETEINALVHAHKLQDRVTYVSWVPEALYAIHDLAPDIPLCLSHWCQSPDTATRKKHKVFKAKDGHVPRPSRNQVHGERSGWWVDGPLRGELREIIAKTGGSVCVPEGMVSAELVVDYHKDKIKVSTFSYLTHEHIKTHQDHMNIDLYFIDNKTVFDQL